MENTSEKKDKNSVKKPLKHICIGLVAHVDAGKTTLSEGMLYLSVVRLEGLAFQQQIPPGYLAVQS